MAVGHRAPHLDLTRETPAPGLVVWQPRRGYRYGVEVYLLGDFALRGAPVRKVVELGAGSGVLSLLLASQGVEVVAVEREAAWLPLLERSVAESGFQGRVTLVADDARTYRGDADLVVTNPPWFMPEAGPHSPDPWRAAARTALHGSPEDLVRVGLGIAPRVATVGPRVPAVGLVSRWGRHGRLWLAELRPDAGETPRGALEGGLEETIDAPLAYARFRGA